MTAGLRTEGRYLMSKFSSSGVKKNNELISSCTAESVAATLANCVSSFFHSLKFLIVNLDYLFDLCIFNLYIF